MAGGSWSETEKKIRPGFYMRFQAAALSAINTGARGILAIPVKANWGPSNEIQEITTEKELIDTYGNDTDGTYTAYQSIRLALLGGVKTVLVYRLCNASAAKATVTLKDNASTGVLKLETKYPTTKSFKVTTRDSIIDSAKQELILYEGANQLYSFSFEKGASVVDNAIAVINNDTQNAWLIASKVAEGDGTIAAVVSQPLAGGNDGTASITNANYIAAMEAFEARVFDVFTLDGISEASLQSSVVAWIKRLREEGKKVVAYLGGSSENDATINIANTRSTSFNHEGIVNVGVSALLDGFWFSSSQVACYVAGKASGQELRESLTYSATPFNDVKPRLTNNQVISAIEAGTLVLVHDGEKVVIEKGINTLTSLGEGQNNAFKKIKLIRIMDAIDTDITRTAQDNYIGKVLNNDDGRAAVLSAIKSYFETLAPNLIDDDFTVEVDQELQANANGDEFYLKWNARLVDSMEEIYGTGIVRY